MVGHRSAGNALLRTLIVLVVLAAAVLLAATFWPGRPPRIAIRPALPGIGKSTPVLVTLDDTGQVEKVTVEVVQGMDVKPVAEKSFVTHPRWAFWKALAPARLELQIGRDTVPGLRSGKATIRVTAQRSGSLVRRPDPVVAALDLPVRLTPPSLAVLSGFHYVAQGGCEAVVYRVGDGAVRDGVQSGRWWFPGYPLPGGSDPRARFALFAVPYDTSDDSQVRLVAVDDVGNQAQASFVDRFFPKPLKHDTIQLTDAFLERAVPEIMRETPALQDRGGPLPNYLEINGELRRRNSQELEALAGRSAPRFLWKEPFLPLPNAKITAAFAQRRDYQYNGKHVDQQDHLGFDMASVEHDAVPASNSGVVLLARYFGIFGNAVVIDHGYGLMSLYGHLSSIGVQQGQQVQRGQELGRSGKTGLAGGDHLHFTTMLRGLPVNPVEWWDPHWIKDRLARKLGPALAFAGGAATSAAAAAPPTPAAARAARRRPRHGH
ncbi:MAG TPA: M23 family metallopeptidase [Thermoanaerobaculia bacterium]|jgi:murein DD-endopeptidase MepM/ murein hydrolase activator NlpD|nr:M23 family metallopeptidase [Thermoanaerobaculia bacterium]